MGKLKVKHTLFSSTNCTLCDNKDVFIQYEMCSAPYVPISIHTVDGIYERKSNYYFVHHSDRDDGNCSTLLHLAHYMIITAQSVISPPIDSIVGQFPIFTANKQFLIHT